MQDRTGKHLTPSGRPLQGLELALANVERLRGAPVAFDLPTTARAHHRLDASRPAPAPAQPFGCADLTAYDTISIRVIGFSRLLHIGHETIFSDLTVDSSQKIVSFTIYEVVWKKLLFSNKAACFTLFFSLVSVYVFVHLCNKEYCI